MLALQGGEMRIPVLDGDVVTEGDRLGVDMRYLIVFAPVFAQDATRIGVADEVVRGR
jgi:hypothetical protein